MSAFEAIQAFTSSWLPHVEQAGAWGSTGAVVVVGAVVVDAAVVVVTTVVVVVGATVVVVASTVVSVVSVATTNSRWSGDASSLEAPVGRNRNPTPKAKNTTTIRYLMLR